MHFYYPLKPIKNIPRRLYAQREYLAGEWQERPIEQLFHFLDTEKNKTDKFHSFSDWIAIWQPSKNLTYVELGKGIQRRIEALC